MLHKFPSNWKVKKLDQLGFVGRGRSRHRPRNEPSLYGGKYPFFQTGDIKSANLYLLDYSQTYSEKGLMQSKLWEPGTLCITIAANIAETAILGIRGCFPDSVIGFIADPAKADVRFIKYYIDLIKLDMQQVSHGTTQDNLSLEKLLSFDFVVPDVKEQVKIAAILSAYDDLIENNLRRIKILEEMAQNLYREWFVKFRFPGQEKAKFVDSPLGRIPEGWEINNLGSIIAEHIGGGWGNDVADGKYTESAYVIRGTDIPDARLGNIIKVPLRYHKKSNLKSRCLIPGDIIFEVSGGSKGQPLGRSLYVSSELLKAFNGYPLICASFCKRIKPDSNQYASEILYLSFLDAYVSGEIEQYQVQSTGISNYKWSDYLEKANRCIPPIVLRDHFRKLIIPLFSEIAIIGRENTTLRNTRDFLLPKLISGEVDVSELDIKIP